MDVFLGGVALVFAGGKWRGGGVGVARTLRGAAFVGGRVLSGMVIIGR